MERGRPESSAQLRQRIFVLRILLGLLLVLALLGWTFAVRAGKDLDTYWWHLQWVQRLMDAGQRERQLHQRLNHTVGELFQALEHCRCDGDPEARNQLWVRFLDLLEQETRLSQHSDRLFRDYEQRNSLPEVPP